MRERREKTFLLLLRHLLFIFMIMTILSFVWTVRDWISSCFLLFSPLIMMNEIDFEECLKDSPSYRYVPRSHLLLPLRHVLEKKNTYVYISSSCSLSLPPSFLFLSRFLCFSDFSLGPPGIGYSSMQFLFDRNQLRQATTNIDMLEDRLEQVNQYWITFVQ